MARKASAAVVESHEVTAEQTPGLTKAVEAVNLTAAIQADYNQGRDLVNQMLGQTQMAMASSELLQTFGVSKMKFIKENKLYQQIAGMKTPNGLELRGTWVEFCELLGVSDEKANNDIANLSAFGEAALERMSSIGIGYRDLRQFRRLPQDERLALIEAAKAGDKDDLLDLAESLIAKHTKEKEALTKANEDLKADADATDRVLADNQKAITKLQKAAAGKQIDAHEEWSGAMKELALHVAGHRAQILESVTALDVIRETVMQQEAEPGAEAALAAAREQIGRELAEAVERVEALVSKVRRLFDCTLGALIG
jgi:hypothetical protein